jgi:DNA mismatch repair protein MutS
VTDRAENEARPRESQLSGDHGPGSDAKPKTSPMMAQYSAIKAAHAGSLLFYRMGDFYELFFDDAEIAAKALGIVLTKRGKHQGRDIPMCGVPIERSDDYLHRLIAQGHRVAICEQTEDPAEARRRGGKSVVRREVVRVLTPGTIIEDRLLDPSRPNILLAIAVGTVERRHSGFGLAAAEISTGTFCVTEVSEDRLAAEIARIDPAEIVLPESLLNAPVLSRILRESSRPVTPLGHDTGGRGSAEHRLTDFFGLATLDGLGPLSAMEIAAASLAIFYLERTQCSAKPALGLPSRRPCGHHMEMDAATRTNLELTATATGLREGSLFCAIDSTMTAAGGRLLLERLSAPLTDVESIARRHDAIGFFRDEAGLRAKIRARLRSVPDFARALSRLALERGGPRDLASLRDGLAAARAIASILTEGRNLPREIELAAIDCAAVDRTLVATLEGALAESLPLARRDGGFVRRGFDSTHDELCALREESRQVVAALQARYAEIAETRQLKLKHNNFLGYFLEVPQARGERLREPPHDSVFVHRQTMAGAMRFSTKELADLEAKIAGAADAAVARELTIFDELTARVLGHGAALKRIAAALAEIDVAAALAEVAASRDWVRPEVDRSLAFEIEAGRHPVVEAGLRKSGQTFVANDCILSGFDKIGGRIAVVTGPNMAGKSTYLRQNALIAVLAQAGSYVPARRARIGCIDRLSSRVGAADDLARGRSTFMVEMIETAAILNQASERSFVILDEIGRGTATFDGLSIAWAVMEHLHDKVRARVLFATHFHELTELARRRDRIDNLTVRVTDCDSDIVFLHEIVPGAADRSYGIQVASLAGLPRAVVERAKHLLAELEAADRAAHAERLAAGLPLFAAPARAAPVDPDPALTALDALDPDALSPRDALDALYRLKALRTPP